MLNININWRQQGRFAAWTTDYSGIDASLIIDVYKGNELIRLFTSLRST
jgi:hypothetical protein